MTQEASPQAVVRINRPETLLASLPALFGFAPSASLVVVCLQGAAASRRVGASMRCDLPTDRQGEWELLRYAHEAMAARRPDAVLIAVVGGDLEGTELPHTWLIDRLGEAMAGSGIDVLASLWAPAIHPGAGWSCYEGCCAGLLPDPTATEAAAHTALLGRRTYLSREDATAAITPDAAAASPARRQALDTALGAAVARRTGHGDLRAVREDLDTLRAACATVGRGEPIAEADLMGMVAALIDPRVRDVALGFAAGCDDTVTAEDATALWALLTRAAPAPEVAEPATLAACAALCAGGGAVMTAAIDRARTADPEHRLSGLVATMIAASIEQQTMRDMIVKAATQTAAEVDF